MATSTVKRTTKSSKKAVRLPAELRAAFQKLDDKQRSFLTGYAQHLADPKPYTPPPPPPKPFINGKLNNLALDVSQYALYFIYIDTLMNDLMDRFTEDDVHLAVSVQAIANVGMRGCDETEEALLDLSSELQKESEAHHA